MKQFKIAGGTVTGSTHSKIGKNNQDAYEVYQTENLIIAVVADGCGSKSCVSSEVGSKLGAKLLVNSIANNYPKNPDLSIAQLLEKAKQDILSHINLLSNSLDPNPILAINDYFLFTLVGVVITKEETVIFSIGDGVFIVNGEVEEIGPFPDNEPPYIAYNLTQSSMCNSTDYQLDFTIHRSLTTTELKSLLIGTDGVMDLINAQEKNIPGKTKQVGPISQFWEKPSFFTNPDMIRRNLFLLNNEKKLIDWKEKEVTNSYGLLQDDTTIIVISS